MSYLEWKSTYIFELLQKQVKNYNPAYNLVDVCTAAQSAPIGSIMNDCYYYTGDIISTVFGVENVMPNSFLVYSLNWYSVSGSEISASKADLDLNYSGQLTSSFVNPGIRELFISITGKIGDIFTLMLSAYSGSFAENKTIMIFLYKADQSTLTRLQIGAFIGSSIPLTQNYTLLLDDWKYISFRNASIDTDTFSGSITQNRAINISAVNSAILTEKQRALAAEDTNYTGQLTSSFVNPGIRELFISITGKIGDIFTLMLSAYSGSFAGNKTIMIFLYKADQSTLTRLQIGAFIGSSIPLTQNYTLLLDDWKYISFRNASIDTDTFSGTITQNRAANILCNYSAIVGLQNGNTIIDEYFYTSFSIDNLSNGALVFGNTLKIPSGSTGTSSRIQFNYASMSSMGFQAGDTVTFVSKILVNTIGSINTLFFAQFIRQSTTNLLYTSRTCVIDGNYLVFKVVHVITDASNALNILLQVSNSSVIASDLILTPTFSDVSKTSTIKDKVLVLNTINQLNTGRIIALESGSSETLLYAYSEGSYLSDTTTSFYGKNSSLKCSIQRAIDSITDASASKKYVIICIGVFKATDTNQFTNLAGSYYSFISLKNKNYISLRGMGVGRTIISGYLPNTYTSTIYQYYQTIFNESNNCIIENLTVIGQNVRYPIHTDQSIGGCANYIEKYNNVLIEHKGNTANALTGWTSFHPLGLGIASGQEIYLNGCTLKSSINPIYIHTNPNYTKPFLLEFKNCKLINSGTNYVLATIAPLSANIEGELRLIGCDGLGFIVDAGRVMASDEKYFAPDINEIRIKGYGNTGIGCIGSKYTNQLRIQVADTTAARSIRFVESSTAFAAIVQGQVIEDNKFAVNYSNGWCYKDSGVGYKAFCMGLKVCPTTCGDSNNITTYSLGNRLGDCSITAKTLSVLIGAIQYDITFNHNYIGATNASILAEMNTQLVGVATADLWSLANDYYPETDNVSVLSNVDTAPLIIGTIVTLSGTGVKKCASTDAPAGVLLDNLNIGEYGRILKSGLISAYYSTPMTTFGNYRFYVLNSVNSTTVKGQRYSVSAGKLTPDSNGKFNSIDAGIILF